MALLPIIEVPDPRLRIVSSPVDQVDDALRDLIADMFDTMYDAPGIGLAAIQVGVPKRVLVMDLQEQEGEDGKPIRDPRVFINPVIHDPSEDQSLYTEGCLSVPDQFADVERPARCRVTWLDEKGEAHDEVFEGLWATCIQHEMDHLEGVVFIDHLSRLKRDMIMKKLNKARKAAA
ncbi:peptide deformylase [Sphingomonas sp. HF-S3]|uniref:Peptide deformylase n=1 Tax=Sphingomonas rustica TaxID=3103142 RepID=A0ABV0B5N3_9SPHN